MASIRKRGKNYYSRITWYTNNKRTEIGIPLGTNKKSVAEVRNHEVEGIEQSIKCGKEWSFSWLNDSGKTELLRHTISETFEEYKSVQNINGIRPSTIERSEYALKTFTNVFGETFPVESITESHIDEWKEYWTGKHKPNTININLSKIKAYLNWCYKKGYIPERLDITLVVADEKPVSYLKDSDLAEIMKTDAVEPHFKRAFLFYFMTGCRKAEPFNGTIAGEWLIIEPNKAKSHRTREIQLNSELLNILIEMRNRHDGLIKKYRYKSKHIIDRYSKEFKKACRSVGIEDRHLHNLRDTYAVMRWAITGDIKLVSDEIGHTSVTMTERYTKCNLRRLQSDFPTIADIIERRLNKPIEDGYFISLLNGEKQSKNGKVDIR